MRKAVVILMIGLAGCDMPSPAFRGVPAQQVSVGQSTFAVRVVDNRAEAIRLNAEYASRPSAVAPRAVIAIEQVSGCTVKRLTGDQAQFFARLKC